MLCTQKVKVCNTCSGILTPQLVGRKPNQAERFSESPNLLREVVVVFELKVDYCSNCKKSMTDYHLSICGGEIFKVHTDPKSIHLKGYYMGDRCNRCDHDYGRNYLDRERILESFMPF